MTEKLAAWIDRAVRGFLVVAGATSATAGVLVAIWAALTGAPLGKLILFECATWADFGMCALALRPWWEERRERR